MANMRGRQFDFTDTWRRKTVTDSELMIVIQEYVLHNAQCQMPQD